MQIKLRSDNETYDFAVVCNICDKSWNAFDHGQAAMLKNVHRANSTHENIEIKEL